ncbi:uncharacterized protein [Channa argus]|uniref:uncharacterized protein n=1 Tax=Channa argus TaxID=215402 RepID=UPI003522BB86
MKMISTKVTFFCVACLVQTSVSAVQKLDSINDLKKINFAQSVPKHSLLLLYWFADTVRIDNNNVIRLTFDPNDGDYGTHYYGNFERVLDPLPQGYRYYTVGNLNHRSPVQFPPYVTHPGTEYDGRNRDRIIFRVRGQNLEHQDWPRIDRVYITQHYETSERQGTRYEREHTYQVTTNLLRQIRAFSAEPNQWNSLSEVRDNFESNADDSKLQDIRNTWGHLACLGLLLYIVIQEKYSSNQHNRPQGAAGRRNHSTHSDFVVNIPENRQDQPSMRILQANQKGGITLKVVTGTNGKARILWSKIPRHSQKEGVMVVLFENNEGQKAKTYKCIGMSESGSYDTSVPLNNGLQARLHDVRTRCCFFKGVGEEICRGREFKNPDAVNITDYNASLQIFAKDGKACARLYVTKSFRNWRSEFNKSWVGFYTSENKATNNYEWRQWQWATKFKFDSEDFFYDVYVYHSSMSIAPGVQARFILRDEVVKARTPSWK